MTVQEIGGFRPTPELVLRLNELEEKRNRRGARWCKSRGVGMHRRMLGQSHPYDATPIFQSDAERGLAHAKEAAKAILAGVCRSCGRCSLGKTE